MMNQGTRGTWGFRFYNVNVAKACRNEEKNEKTCLLEDNCHIQLSISTGDGTAHSSRQRNIMIHNLLCFMDTMKDDALLLFRKNRNLMIAMLTLPENLLVKIFR